MTKELYKDYPTQQNSCVSSLSTHENYTVAGFGDGTIKLFDLRKPNALAHHIRSDSINSSSFSILNNTTRQLSITSSSYLSDKTESIPQHKAFVLNVKIHKQTNKLITASTAGDFNVFDLRNMQCDYKSPLPTKVEMATAVECHPYNELIAV